MALCMAITILSSSALSIFGLGHTLKHSLRPNGLKTHHYTSWQLRTCLAKCSMHYTFVCFLGVFFERHGNFSTMLDKNGENTTSIIESANCIVCQNSQNTDFLIVDKLIHGCTNTRCKRNLMVMVKNVDMKICLKFPHQHEAVDVIMKLKGKTVKSVLPTAGTLPSTYRKMVAKPSKYRATKNLAATDNREMLIRNSADGAWKRYIHVNLVLPNKPSANFARRKAILKRHAD